MNYVGIDLGTTNSAICSFDGELLRLYKSPDQFDVTPSAIFIDKRGNRYVGSRAYNNAARNPDNAATLFKRLMGTGTPLLLPAVGMRLTPEECSAEVLRTLFGYLPEDLRGESTAGTVITVPAAFNQMQKDATMTAADAARIGRVALMQEPVAAVMSVMRSRKNDGVFLIFDLGGGTLDIALAEGIAGRVSLMAHGGIAMCGGRDFDRAIFQGIVKPWLLENFDLPDDFEVLPQFKTLRYLSTWAVERAKIELSQREDAVISLPETELGTRDRSGQDIYIDLAITRHQFDHLIEPKVMESIAASREALAKAGMGANDVERIVFVGGPTQYKPLRDRVAAELGIAPSTDVNPMTAVAEGAAVFAESIDWTSESRGRKSARGVLAPAIGALDLSLNYLARTPDSRARIVARVKSASEGAELQIDSMDTGWSSGRLALLDGAAVEVVLSKPGENTFRVFVFDADGGSVALRENSIVIARTAASVDAIPASHSIAVEVQERIGGPTLPDYLVREGEQLPKKGRRTYKAAESLKSGAASSLNFRLWEGEISDPLTDNRPIGVFKISGGDFEDGVIPAGADLVCDYEVRDSGQIILEVTVPSIGGSFAGRHNFYSRVEGQIDYTNAVQLIQQQSSEIEERLGEMASRVEDSRLDEVRERLDRAAAVSPDRADPESAKQALDDLQDAKRLLAQARKAHLREIRQLELDGTIKTFNDHVRQYARPTEESAFDNLSRTAQRAIERNGAEFEAHLDELRGKNFMILWRQDWFVVDRFRRLVDSPFLFPDARHHAQLVATGDEALRANDVDKLRQVVALLDSARVAPPSGDELMASANIIRG